MSGLVRPVAGILNQEMELAILALLAHSLVAMCSISAALARGRPMPRGDVIDRISIGFSTCFSASDYLYFDVDTDAAFRSVHHAGFRRNPFNIKTHRGSSRMT